MTVGKEQTMRTRFAELTWPEIEAARDEGAITIVPLGAVEQHGPHLPVETDYRLATTVAERAAAAASEQGTPTLVTPPLWTGYSPHHMDFPGTVTLRATTLLELITDVAVSLWRHGLRKILVLNGHGGNANLLGTAVQKLRFEHDVPIAGATYWSFASDHIPEWRESGPGGIDHACEMEACLMLHARPELVKAEEFRDATWFPHSDYLTGDLAIGAPVQVAWRLKELTADGTLGDAARGSAERGEELMSVVVEALTGFLHDFRRWDWDDPQSI
jgi:creatinine amidohydrolase